MSLDKALAGVLFLSLLAPGLRAQGAPSSVSPQDYSRRLAEEVRAKRGILQPEYDYRPWRRLQSDQARKAQAPSEREAWRKAGQTLDAMERYSRLVKESRGLKTVSEGEFRDDLSQLLNAVKPLKLENDRELLKFYLAQLPPVQSLRSSELAKGGMRTRQGAGFDAGKAAGLKTEEGARKAFDSAAGRQDLEDGAAGGGLRTGSPSGPESAGLGSPSLAAKAPPAPRIPVKAARTVTPDRAEEEKRFEGARTKVILGRMLQGTAVVIGVVAVTGAAAVSMPALLIGAGVTAAVGTGLHLWGESEMPAWGWDKIRAQFASAPKPEGRL